jgi:hypothetical protein
MCAVEERPVVLFDHPHGRTHHAGELEHSDPRGERIRPALAAEDVLDRGSGGQLLVV